MGNEKPIITLKLPGDWWGTNDTNWTIKSGLTNKNLTDDEKPLFNAFNTNKYQNCPDSLDANETADFYNKLMEVDGTSEKDGKIDEKELAAFAYKYQTTIDAVKTFITRLHGAKNDKGEITIQNGKAVAEGRQDDTVPPGITIGGQKLILKHNVKISDIDNYIMNLKTITAEEKYTIGKELNKLITSLNKQNDGILDYEEVQGLLKRIKLNNNPQNEYNDMELGFVAVFQQVSAKTLKVLFQALASLEGAVTPVEQAKPADGQPKTTTSTAKEALDAYDADKKAGKEYTYTIPKGATVNYVLNDIFRQMGVPQDQITDADRQNLLNLIGDQNGGLKAGRGLEANNTGLFRPIKKDGTIVNGFWAGQQIKLAVNITPTPLGGATTAKGGDNTSKTQGGQGSKGSDKTSTTTTTPKKGKVDNLSADVGNVSTGTEDTEVKDKDKSGIDILSADVGEVTQSDDPKKIDNGGSENSGEVDKPSTTEEEYENKPFNKGHDAKGINFNNTGVLNPIDVFTIDKIKDTNNGGYLVNQEKGLYAEVKKDKKEITLTFHETNSTSSPVTKKIVMKLSDKNDLKHPKEICEYDASGTLVAIQKRTYTGKGESAQLDSLVETAQSGPNVGQVTKEYKEIELEKGKKEKKFINYDYGTGTRIMNIFGSEKESNLTGKEAILACEKTIIETTSGDKRTTERTIIERNKNGNTANIKYTKHFENGLLEKRNNVYCEFKDVKMDPKTGNPIEKGEYYDAKTMTSVKISDKLFRKAEYANGELVITKYNNSDVSINDENPLSSKINGNAIFTFRKKEINGKLQPIRKIDKTDKKAEKTTVWFYDNSGNLLGNAERTVNNDNGKTTANILWTVGEKSGIIHEKGQEDEVKQMLDKLGLTEDTAFNEGNTKANK